MPTDIERLAEASKYTKVYALCPDYRMNKRMPDAMSDLKSFELGSTYLDVGCGRGEMIAHAEWIGLKPMGTEVVPYLCDGHKIVYAFAHKLPFEDKSFDYSSMFDVLEHLLQGDDYLALTELMRVTRKRVVVTANNKPSRDWGTGDDYHVNIRDYNEWNTMIKEVFHTGKVKRLSNRVSETWRIDL